MLSRRTRRGIVRTIRYGSEKKPSWREGPVMRANALDCPILRVRDDAFSWPAGPAPDFELATSAAASSFSRYTQ
jgi:hypothetical protein